MYILSFYLFWAIFTFLFGIIFGLDFNSFNELSFYIFGFLCLLIGVILSFLLQLGALSLVGSLRKGTKIDSKFNHRYANALLDLAMHLLRVKVIVTGKDNIPERNFVFISNHQENYDIVVLKPIFKNHPISAIAKESIISVPIIGKWILLLGNIPISRYADRRAAQTIVKGIKQVKRGIPMGIFPEGRRSFSNKILLNNVI